MKKNTYLYRLRTWLRHYLTAWNTGGEGVHSPYLFEWVRMVMYDKHAYRIWNNIEQVRARMIASREVVEFVDYGSGMRLLGEKASSKRLVREIAKGSLAKAKYAQVLFRLVNWLGHQLRKDNEGLTLVELGTSLGVTTAYLAGVDTRDKVYTYEGCEAVAKIAKENWKLLGINNIDCRVGEITADILDRDLERVDVAFIDANHTYAGTRAYFNVLAEKVHRKSVMIVDDIHYNKEMEQAWREICADERVTSTMDLYQMGLVFFDKDYWKRDYRIRV